MALELNRRTFLALVGASTAAVTFARPSRTTPRTAVCLPQGCPRCFMGEAHVHPPARPRTAAITYLYE